MNLKILLGQLDDGFFVPIILCLRKIPLGKIAYKPMLYSLCMLRQFLNRPTSQHLRLLAPVCALPLFIMFSFFNRRPKEDVPEALALVADMHSHLLPGLDDGSDNIDESMDMIRTFIDRGFQRLYTTPHIIHDFYPNGPETIAPALELVRQAIAAEGLPVTIDAAAEYFLDEAFMDKITNKEPLMTFGDRYVLFETPFLNEPIYLRQVIFELLTSGYKPVLAHPERYQYLFGKWAKIEELFDSGVLFQVNAMSLLGHYNKPSQDIAEKLVDKAMLHFIGTDCHKPKHQEIMKALPKLKSYKKALELPLLNRNI